MNHKLIFSGVAFMTLAVLVLELTLTRLFSATMYYHFAFMAISLALLGSGVSGVFVYLQQQKLDEERTGQWLSLASILFALTTVAALSTILTNPLVTGGEGNLARLLKIFAATTLPFFFAGCAVTLAITRLAKEISRLYLFDLAGAALGCLLFIPVVNAMGAINAVLLVSCIGAVAAILFSRSSGGGRGHFIVALLLAIALISFLGVNITTDLLDVTSAKGKGQTEVLFSKWNSFSRVTVERVSESLQIQIDADASTHIARNSSSPEVLEHYRGRMDALAYQIGRPERVLIIGPGGGNDVMSARAAGVDRITAVEINPIIAEEIMSSDTIREYSGDLYFQPDVELVVDEGRSFIRGSSERYDVIQGTMVDTWAATAAGAFALTENNLYTVEAFKDYARHLADDGMLTMTRWFLEPPDEALRLVSLTLQMMKELDIRNAPRHIVYLRETGPPGYPIPATFIFKKSEFTDDEVRKIERIAAEKGLEILYTPLTRPENDFKRLIEADDPSSFRESYPGNIEPPRDNNPFFFNSIRISSLGEALRDPVRWRKRNLGAFVLIVSLAFTTLVVIGFMIGPLALARGRELARSSQRKYGWLMYFACLGAGFMIVEVAMIQKFILFLGHPVYALAVVLFSLLTFCALGSWLSGRFEEAARKRGIVRVLVGLVALTIVYIFALPPIFYGLVHLGIVLRIGIAVLLLAPLAVMMGMPMPTGIRILADNAPGIIPWAWGINGATSVMGSVAALVIAILTGFNQALVIGSALYLLAILFLVRAAPVEGARSELPNGGIEGF